MKQIKLLIILIIALLQINNILCKYNIKKLFNKYNNNNQQQSQLTSNNNNNVEFSYNNCGPANDPLQIKTLTVTPDPIKFPCNLTITADVTLAKNISSPITVAMKIVRKTGPFSIEIPCIDNLGSCTYNDVCTMLPPTPSQCPEIFIENNIPCDCPFPQGVFSAKNLILDVNVNAPIPSGLYQITVDISNNGAHVGCLYIEANYS